jgi:hypothetical protein
MIAWELEIEDAVTGTMEAWRKATPPAIRRVLLQEGNALAREMKLGIRGQSPGGKAFRPLAESTIKRKKSSKALIDKGDLMGSINVTPIPLSAEVAVFVGVNRGKRTKDGKDLMNIAEIHEFGTRPFMIPVTPKLRAWWYAMYKQGVMRYNLSRRTFILNHPGVPERPFLRPAFDAWKRGANGRVLREIANRMGFGKFKRPVRYAIKLTQKGAKIMGKFDRQVTKLSGKGFKAVGRIERKAVRITLKKAKAFGKATGLIKTRRRRAK